MNISEKDFKLAILSKFSENNCPKEKKKRKNEKLRFILNHFNNHACKLNVFTWKNGCENRSENFTLSSGKKYFFKKAAGSNENKEFENILTDIVYEV